MVDWKTSPSFSYQPEFLEVAGVLFSPHPLEVITATLLDEDGIFGSYAAAHHLEQVVRVCIVTTDHDHIHWSCAVWVWLVFHPSFSSCPLLGTC